MVDDLTTFSGRRASQNAHELRSFMKLLQSKNVQSYLEIGAREGDTFHDIMMILPRGSRGVAVDLPGGKWGKFTTRPKLERAVADLVKRGYRASCYFGDSTTDASRSTIRMRGPYDAILIDGDHSYEGVKKDWENYGEWAPIVAFHDIAGHDQYEQVHGTPVEVPRLWNELRVDRNFLEYIDDGSKMGIGVILNA
jgi:hypothetical protein